MTGLQVVWIVSLVGWLVLALASYGARDVPLGKTLRLAAVWCGIFSIVVLLFSMAGF